MSAILRKYGTGTGADVIIPMIKAGSVDHAVGADWTPAAGDVKVSKDGGAAANIGTLPTFVTDIGWKFVFSDAELQAKTLNVQVTDSATKAVEDQHFIVETYGNASAMYPTDFSETVLPVNATHWNGSPVATPATAGYPAVTLKVGTGTGEVNLSSGKAPATIAAGDIAANAITATSIATDAITSTKIADNAIAASKIASGALTSAKFASGAITATVIATDAIDADALAADAVAEINATVDTALSDIGLDHIVSASVAGADVTDNSIVARLVSKESTADWDDYDNTTDSLQALRDRGDTAWITATGFSTLTTADIDARLAAIGLDHLVAVAESDDVVDDSIIAKLASKGVTADWSTFNNTTDSLEAGFDRVSTSTQVADAVLNRAASNIQDTADKHSLGALVLIATNSSLSGDTLTAKKPGDDSTFNTYTVATDANADPITGVE